MAKLTAAERKKLPASKFAGPDRSYPIPDKSHARNALSRASEQHNKGSLSDSEYSHIKGVAKAMLKGDK